MFSDNNDLNEQLKISDYVKSLYASILPIHTKYNIIITGPVSVGKTTILNALYHLLKLSNQEIQTFPEFVCTKLGRELLSKNLSKEISALTFQSYVLDFWDKEPNFKNVNLFERCLDDTIYVFCKYQLHHGNLTELEYKTLEEKMKRINMKWNLPSFDKEYKLVTLNTDKSIDEILYELYKIVQEDIKDGVETRIISLDLSSQKILERIKFRGRDGESAYSLEYIDEIRKSYYDMLKV